MQESVDGAHGLFYSFFYRVFSIEDRRQSTFELHFATPTG
jgi:hypothetical protein